MPLGGTALRAPADLAILSIERDAERLKQAGFVTSDWHNLPQRGIVVDTADMADASAVGAACAEPLSVLWIETPSNPMLNIVDIRKAADAAHAAGAMLMADGGMSV